MFKKIAPDKWRHFYAGIIMGVLLQGLALWLFPDRVTTSVVITLLVVCAISYGFELFSKITSLGRYDFMDAVATVIGGVLGMGAVVLLLVRCY